jgi:hypothetical protein
MPVRGSTAYHAIVSFRANGPPQHSLAGATKGQQVRRNAGFGVAAADVFCEVRPRHLGAVIGWGRRLAFLTHPSLHICFMELQMRANERYD